MGAPFYITAFEILPLPLTFGTSIMIGLGVHLFRFIFRFIFLGIVCFLDLYVCFTHQVRDVFNPFLLLWQHYDTNVSMLDDVPEVPKLSSLKFFCCSDFSTTMSSALLI